MLNLAHSSGRLSVGVDIDVMRIIGASGVSDKTGVLDLYYSKVSAFKLAIDAGGGSTKGIMNLVFTRWCRGNGSTQTKCTGLGLVVGRLDLSFKL